jgi:hypothetical protein
MADRRPLALIAAQAVCALLLAGCASTGIEAQWKDPKLSATSLRGATVLVVCEASDEAVRRICQDQLVAEVVAHGATPIAAMQGVSAPGQALNDEQYLRFARAAGAKAVLVSAVGPGQQQVSPGFSIGLGGFSAGSSGVSAGVGVSMPVGGGNVTTGYAASGRLVDAASGQLMWTARATTPPSNDINQQMVELAKAVVGAAEKAGLF